MDLPGASSLALGSRAREREEGREKERKEQEREKRGEKERWRERKKQKREVKKREEKKRGEKGSPRSPVFAHAHAPRNCVLLAVEGFCLSKNRLGMAAEREDYRFLPRSRGKPKCQSPLGEPGENVKISRKVAELLPLSWRKWCDVSGLRMRTARFRCFICSSCRIVSPAS